MSRRKQIVKRLLQNLNTKKPDGKPGPLERTPKRWASAKDRRASGWNTPRLIKPTMKYSEVHAEALEPEKVYDEWNSERDGWRMHTATDQLYHKWRSSGPRREDIYEQNNKLIKMIKIRRARLEKQKQLNK